MRWTIQSAEGQTKLSIRPRRDLFVILFLVFWIALWVAGEATLAAVMLGGTQAFLSGNAPNTISTFRYLWPLIGAGLIAWSAVGLAMIYVLVWECFGREEVTTSADSVAVHRRVLSFSSEKVYPRDEVNNLRFDDRAGWWLSNLEYWGLAGGKLSFEYSGRTIRCGLSLDAEAAQRISSEIIA